MPILIFVGAGAVIQEMRNKLKANRDLLRSRKPYEKWNDRAKMKFGDPIQFMEATKAEKQQFMIEHRERMRKFRMMKILSVLVSIIIVVGIVAIVNSIGSSKVQEPIGPTIVYSEDYYLQYLQESNLYLYQGDYENAILYAQHALKCGVEGWYGKYRLALVYKETCYQTETYCVEAYKLAQKLNEKHPNNPELKALLD